MNTLCKTICNNKDDEQTKERMRQLYKVTTCLSHLNFIEDDYDRNNLDKGKEEMFAMQECIEKNMPSYYNQMDRDNETRPVVDMMYAMTSIERFDASASGEEMLKHLGNMAAVFLPFQDYYHHKLEM